MFDKFQLVRLKTDSNLSPFDCSDDDLNDFFLNDSISHLEQLLSVTYAIENEEENRTIAFFSLLNDKISVEDLESGNQFKKLFKAKFPARKKFKSYPAIKIGRLGVCKDHQNEGIGTTILDYIKELFISNNRTGCRFVTVDAYKESLKFYERNGFIYITKSDNNLDTRLMYCDLKKEVLLTDA